MNCYHNIGAVRLEANSGEPLQMFEVQVFSSDYNVALGGSAIQSSTYKNNSKFMAMKSIDDDSTTFSHTASDDTAAFWNLSLDSSSSVNKVTIMNRWCGKVTMSMGASVDYPIPRCL
jgi:hypothetical protein